MPSVEGGDKHRLVYQEIWYNIFIYIYPSLTVPVLSVEAETKQRKAATEHSASPLLVEQAWPAAGRDASLVAPAA